MFRVRWFAFVLPSLALGCAPDEPETSAEENAQEREPGPHRLRSATLPGIDGGSEREAGVAIAVDAGAVDDDLVGPSGLGGKDGPHDGDGPGDRPEFDDRQALPGPPPPGAPGEPIVHCDELYALAADPRIDGVVEPGLFLERVVPTGWPAGPPPGHELRFAAAWRPDGIYVYAEVTDPSRNPASLAAPVWQGDAFEVFLDHDAVFAPPGKYDVAGARQLVVGAPGDDRTNGMRADAFLPSGYQRHWRPERWVSAPTPEGYVVEAFVGAAALGLPELALSAGSKIGLDVAHDVSYPPGQVGFAGNRLGQYFYRVAQPFSGGLYDYPFANSNVFCRPTLLAP